ncbi:hypothetical protein [Paenisporosarcina cavernae]|uniref:Sporulation protein n=1 Tax=Paenisporosarcina cavernae TaxID=2320858 RepID=A0A385YUJ5_9BACL|nr:hypothetical protein [Paenisporosarcina cavernae]AYC29143.1 hypothetical protein D3873_04330 [Paenisporosarcina cavernae]
MQRVVTLFFIGFLLALFLVQPSATYDGANFGMQLFTTKLLPYLLPYLIVSKWFMSILFQHSPVRKNFFFYCQLYLIGALGGYPSGAATIVHLAESEVISKPQANHLLGIVHAPSPIFIIGYVGAEILHSFQQALLLLVIFHVANLVLLVFSWKTFLYDSSNTSLLPSNMKKESFASSVTKSAQTMLIVGATVIFFTAVSQNLIQAWKTSSIPFTESMQLAIYSLFEMTAGLEVAHHMSVSIIIIIVIILWNGWSIHMQVYVLAKSMSLRVKHYLFYRIAHSMLVFVICILFLK